MIDQVHGHQWNDDMRFMMDVTTEEDARKRYVDGPWFSVAIGEGLLTSPAQSRAAEAAGQLRPIPEFSLEIMPGPPRSSRSSTSTKGSIKAIYAWRPEGVRLFLFDVIIYTYPDESRFYGQNESLFIDSFEFHLDGTSREEHTDMTTRMVDATDRRDVDLSKNFEPIPVFGDWAGLGRADRSHRATKNNGRA